MAPIVVCIISFAALYSRLPLAPALVISLVIPCIVIAFGGADKGDKPNGSN